MSDMIKWLKQGSHKLSPLLAEQLKQNYLKPGQGSLIRPLSSLKNRVQKNQVVVELAPEHWVNGLNNDNLGGTLGCSINQRLDFIGSFSTTVNLHNLKSLTDHEAVAMIWLDREVKAVLDIAAPAVNAARAWRSGYYGEGIGIAVLDTGVYPHHDLVTPKNRIVAFKDFVNGRAAAYDDNGHGTHCAGDAAGNGLRSKGKYCGAATKASIIGVKVLNANGAGTMSAILAGIQWCISNKSKYGIRIISMSLGSRASVPYTIDPLCRAVEKAWQAGIIVCVAAGNEGPGAKTINSPGNDRLVITVGAADDKKTVSVSDDIIAPFSSRGPTLDGLTKPDVICPGVNIASLRSPGSTLDRAHRSQRVGSYYISMSGTSMATPICAGAVAQLLSKKPALKPNDVKNILVSTCRNIKSDKNSQGAGMIDVLAAVNRLK